MATRDTYIKTLLAITTLAVLLVAIPAMAANVNSTQGNTIAKNVSIGIIAQNLKFNTSTITVPASAKVTVKFNNMDTVVHNVAFYTDSTAKTKIFIGTPVKGPMTITYTFAAPAKAGTYFFRSDSNPTTMTGKFIVK